jgi:alpha-ribazole phosphatase
MEGYIMNLYFVRHGETDENAKKTYYGSTDVSLNEKGVKQALKLEEKLKNIKFDKIYCSERLRAMETAKIITKNRESFIEYDSRINEMDFGIFEGKTYEEIKKIYPEEFVQWEKQWKEFCPKGGESYIMFYNRVKEFMEQIKKLNMENVLIVAHGGVVRSVYAYILNENLDFYWKFASKNADVSIIKYKYGDFFIDSISHTDID